MRLAGVVQHLQRGPRLIEQFSERMWGDLVNIEVNERRGHHERGHQKWVALVGEARIEHRCERGM